MFSKSSSVSRIFFSCQANRSGTYTMENWRARLAVVTGASSGIGAAIVKELVKHDINVVGMARRAPKVRELRETLPPEQQIFLYPLTCDVTCEADVCSSFKCIRDIFGRIDILVNNAGVLRLNSLLEQNNTKDLMDTFLTNVMGTVYCTREAFQCMHPCGHLILINSTAGIQVPDIGPNFPTFNLYSASKHALKALHQTYQQEFKYAKTKIKVTSVFPGPVDTDIFPKEIRRHGDKIEMLQPDDVAQAVIYALSAPAHCQIHQIVLRPVGMSLSEALQNICK